MKRLLNLKRPALWGLEGTAERSMLAGIAITMAEEEATVMVVIIGAEEEATVMARMTPAEAPEDS